MTPIERLVALVKRELGAEDVQVVDATDETPDDVLVSHLPGGRKLFVRLGAVDDREARARRLEMLAESFGETLRNSSASRPPPGLTLHAELQSLAQRAGAIDAAVIDAQSPVVWGAADDDEAAPHLLPMDNVISLDDRRSGERFSAKVSPDPQVTRRAIDIVRGLAETPLLHKGGHLHHVVRDPDFGMIARSFAGIYVLMLVFDATYDELRAERAIAGSLPTIERLVTSLPPMDPTPMGAAAAIRRRRR